MSGPYSFRVHESASWDRLEGLIEQRIHSKDKGALDERIWELFGETWAIMFTDLSGFSRRVESFGIVHFLQTIYESHRLLVPCIDEHNGILLKTEGDSLMVLFKHAYRALDCALMMQKVLAEYNQALPPEEQVLLCVGLGYGRLLKIGDADVFGAEVNAASKLGEDTAKAGEILITESVSEAAASCIQTHQLKLKELPESPPGAARAFSVQY